MSVATSYNEAMLIAQQQLGNYKLHYTYGLPDNRRVLTGGGAYNPSVSLSIVPITKMISKVENRDSSQILLQHA